MSPRIGRPVLAGDHVRARELAAARLDESLRVDDAAWLDAHLSTCAECRSVAAGYDLGRSAFRVLRDRAPEPPRDLWARTSAALESERGRGMRRRGAARRMGLARFGRFVAAPAVGLLVVVMIVSSGLLGGHEILPGGTGPGATPIALAAAADLRVLTRSSDGTVNVMSGQVNAVCPIGSESCGAAPSFAITRVKGVTGTSDLAALSPSQDRIVLTNRTGVFVLPMATPQLVASPLPSARPTSSPAHASTSSPAATPTPGAASSAPATASTASPSATASATPTGSPAATSAAGGTASPTSTDVSGPASPSPSIAVAPAPGGAIQIASDVTVVGSVVYSPDGTQVAFAARPSDGSAGPDIYVWTTGDSTAHALTSDHATQLASWTGAGILAGRVTGGRPSTMLLNPSTGKGTTVPGGAWLPVVDPAGTTAAWWDGTLRLAGDGLTWVPESGRLVLGPWPPAVSTGTADASAAPGASGAAAPPVPQVLATGPLDAWQVRWDEGGTVVAVWLHGGSTSKPGHLSLFPVDAATGLASLARPWLDAAPAAAGFQLRTGRLVWSGPGASGEDVVQVLAWNGSDVGRLVLPAGQGATVVP